ncbi:ubiquitin family-domain-containing protein [Rhypophila decipiens]|uniref:Ubiquitin family-domain-containing protein n=1 Tax=Rhypophila decipiens TaxID=261697 RepID=A0AAN7B733_9PEZI|nr:ubiquitin family-domain-containing protein [Rhypophila decipiens]
MRIFIKTTAGGSDFSIETETSDTVDSVKSQIQDKRGIPEESQRLLYAGKKLEDGTILRDYGIRAEATLELIIRTHGSTAAQSVYRELGPSPSDEAVEERVKQWRSLAEEGSFDDDLDIVDPDIYYRSLEILADKVAEYSEFKRCDGTYDLRDDITWDLETVPRYPAFVNLNQDLRLSFVHAAIAASLWKTSLILSGVLFGLQQLQKTNLCQSSFSLLLKHQDLDAAEIIKIPIQDVDTILKGTLENLKRVHERESNIGLVHESLCAQVFEPCISLFGRLYWPIDGPPNLPTTELILATGRITAILLDIALVSYIGSHSCRFDKDYLKRDARTFGVDPSTDLPGFRCSLRLLACLADFLNKREVWVFEFRTKNQVWETDNKRLGILTRIEDFADIWGPVYAIYASQSHMIRQYNVSKGIIRRESGKRPIMIRGNNKEPATRHAIRCHWHNKSSWLKGLKWKYLPPADDSCLSFDDLLLIRESREGTEQIETAFPSIAQAPPCSSGGR